MDEELPFCKICYTDVDLINRRVCDCSGSMANICFDCLRSTILNRSPDAPTDPWGYPVCPDCHSSYRSCVEFALDRNNWTFMEWLYMTRQTTRYHVYVRFSLPAVILTAMTAVYWMFPNTPQIQLIRYLVNGCSAAIVGFVGYIVLSIFLYFEYEEYQNRPKTQILDILIADSNQTAIDFEGNNEELEQMESISVYNTSRTSTMGSIIQTTIIIQYQ